MADMVMMTLVGWTEAPSVAQAAARLDVAPEAIDGAFGVILVDPARGAFTVRVDSAALGASAGSDPGARGPFCDPRIAHFGPPE